MQNCDLDYLRNRMNQARAAADNAPTLAAARAHRAMQHRYEAVHDEAALSASLPPVDDASGPLGHSRSLM